MATLTQSRLTHVATVAMPPASVAAPHECTHSRKEGYHDETESPSMYLLASTRAARSSSLSWPEIVW